VTESCRWGGAVEAERSESVLLVTQLQSLVGVVTTICAAVGLRVEVRGDLERCGGPECASFDGGISHTVES